MEEQDKGRWRDWDTFFPLSSFPLPLFAAFPLPPQRAVICEEKKEKVKRDGRKTTCIILSTHLKLENSEWNDRKEETVMKNGGRKQ